MVVNIMSWKEAVTTQVEDVDYYLQGILRPGGHAGLIASKKMGKSLLILGMSLCIAVGEDWMGKAVSPGRVLYLNHEISKEAFHERVQLVSKEMGLEPNENFSYITLDEGNLKIDENPSIIKNDILGNLEVKPNILILDPRYGFMRGDENEEKVMNAFMGNIKELRHEHQLAIVTIAHSGKDETRGARGHSLFEDNLDTIMTLTKVSDQGFNRKLHIIGKDVEDQTMALRFTYPVFELVDADLGETKNKVNTAMDFVLNHLYTFHEIERQELLKIGREQGFDENSIQRALKKFGDSIEVTNLPIPGNHKLIKLKTPHS